ncbi:MAG: helix-turn-helix transcriptional regulator [Granulosicoccus sp.]
MGTTNKITDLLNRSPLTIQELATELGISKNSAHVQVRKLEAAGVIVKHEQRHPNGAGKPAYQYKTSAGHEDVHSTAYKPVLDVLMQTISTDFPEKGRLQLLEKTGRSLAKASGLQPGPNLTVSIQQSVDTVNSLGATAELTKKGKNHYVVCHSCPVATLVHKEPLTCHMVASFFAEASGREVSVQCKKNGTVVCGFKFS